MSIHPQDGVVHTEFLWPLLGGIPAAYSLGTSIYQNGSTAYKWLNRARTLSNILTQPSDILKLFQEPAVPQATDHQSHLIDAASLSAGGYFMYWVGNYAYNSFLNHNGPMAKEKLLDMVSHGWNRANSTVQEHKHSKQFQSQLQANINAMHDSGNTTASQNTTSNFEKKNNNLFLLITATIAAYTHSIGALEMQRQTLRDNAKLDGDGASQVSHWDQIDTSSKPPDQSPEGVPYLSKQIKKMYANEDYYSKDKSGIRYTSVRHLSVVRTIFNILLGAYIQANRLIGSGEPSDSITEFSRWATMAMYWEVLVHLLHLHGWGPVYNALQLITKLLYADSGSGDSIAKPTPRGRQEHINSSSTKKQNRGGHHHT